MSGVRDERGRRVRFVVRPGKEPTRDTPLGGQRWHYLTPDGVELEPPAHLYNYPAGSRGRAAYGLAGWRAEVCNWGLVSPLLEPRTRPRVQAWAEAQLNGLGVEVVSADEAALRAECLGLDWWTRAVPAGEGA